MHSSIQIVVGTYDKVLHGMIATVRGSSNVEFQDNFLFEAHSSAVRCLALSPLSASPTASKDHKIVLASGGSDEKINLYHIASSPTQVLEDSVSLISSSFAGKVVLPNPRNRELGSLLHHDSGINALCFPSRSKLLSAADDNTVAITRTRDWTLLSSIKAPLPKARGRPSGDTAPLGGAPSGINGFAVHPSLKLMVTVGKGEKCMRLWNLITGRKAGVLNFDKALFQGMEQGKWGSGEGRKIEWNTIGEEFMVAFEQGVVVFGLDSRPKARIIPSPMTKVHQVRYATIHDPDNKAVELIAISTEDGQILMYSMDSITQREDRGPDDPDTVPTLEPFGRIKTDSRSRIKDFRITVAPNSSRSVYVVSGSSDGAIHIHTLDAEELISKSVISNPVACRPSKGSNSIRKVTNVVRANGSEIECTAQIGLLLGTYNTGRRITCIGAFIMQEAGEVPANHAPVPTAENGTMADDEVSNR